MLLHSEIKLKEWQLKLKNANEYSRELTRAQDKVYQYKYEVINIKNKLLQYK